MTLVDSVRLVAGLAFVLSANPVRAEALRRETTTSEPPANAAPDRFSLFGYSETIVQLFRRALLPGANGVLIDTQTALPIHESLVVQARDVDTPWRADSLDFEVSAWGRAEPTPNDARAPFDGDVQTANVRYGGGPFWMRIGRQSAAGGAARFVRFDGVALGGDAGLGPFAAAYGGYAALPRWGRRPGYRHLGAAEGAASSYAELELERGQHWLFGGEAGYRARFARGALSFHEQREQGGTEHRDAGLDFVVTPEGLVSGGGSALVQLDSRGLSRLRLWADLASPSLALGVELQRADPALLLSRMSVLSVFGGGRYDEAGATATLRALSWLSFDSSGRVQRYSDGRDGARGELGARLVSAGARRTTLRTSYARVLAPENGYHSLRLALAQELAARLGSTLEAYGYFYDRSIAGFRTSSVYAATLAYRALDSLELLWGGSVAHSPYAAVDAQTLVRVSWNLDLAKGPR
ncbi:MAG: hypothetical protein M3020_09905 [Myxococcota bacterium]|jgi:hypothetical protein|nr:hypothetical protein [Myxococcota bacterium]